MSNHRVHAIFEAPFEVVEIARRTDCTTLELAGEKGGPLVEDGGQGLGTILLDIAPAQATRIELLEPGQRLKMYLELEHSYAHDSLQIEQEPPPILYLNDFVPNTTASATAIQNTSQLIAVTC